MKINKFAQFGLLAGSILLVTACDKAPSKSIPATEIKQSTAPNPLDIAQAEDAKKTQITLSELYEKQISSLSDDDILDSMDLLPDNEQKLLHNYILRNSLESSAKEIDKLSPANNNQAEQPKETAKVSVKEAIALQKTWEDKYSTPESKESFPMALLNAVATVASTTKKTEVDNSKTFIMSVEIENNGDIPIKGISGNIEIHNQHDQFLGEASFVSNDEIAPKSKLNISVSLPIEEQLQSLNTIWSSKDDELKYQISFKK